MTSPLAGAASALGPELTALRRALHQRAEIGLDLPRTQQCVLEALDGLGLEISTGQGCTSIVAVLRGRAPSAPAAAAATRPAVLLRGDMDALPLTEETGLDFAAPGEVMHACGHDLHTTGLVGAARLLAGIADELPGDVVFMFQPGEEGHGGAEVMISEGVLDAAGPRVCAAYGLHVMSGMLPRGVFATRPGPLMAAASGLFVTVHGRGGHASRPASAADPIVVAAEMVIALQTMITRRMQVFDPVVLTVGLFQAGTRRNIIPESAHFEATVRTFSAAAVAKVAEESVRLCTELAAAHGMTATVTFNEEEPVTANDPVHAERALATAAELFGEARSLQLDFPVMGSEDFSRVLAEVPGAFVFLGASPGDHTTAPANHSPTAAYDESVLPDAALLLAELARRELLRAPHSEQEKN